MKKARTPRLARGDGEAPAAPGEAVGNGAAPEEVTAGSLSEWLAQREPPVPAALLAHLGGDATGVGAGELEAVLGEEASAALADARAESGERRGAFRLLAADAYLTYACEVALESERPSAGLLRVREQVVEEAGNG